MAYQMFKGDYGSQLRAPDYSGIERAGQAYGEMAKGLGQTFGAAIEKYGLNKQKRDALTTQLETRLRGPRGQQLIQSLTSSGNKDFDKGNQTLIDKVLSGDARIVDLERMSGITSTLVEEQAAMSAQENATLKRALDQATLNAKNQAAATARTQQVLAEKIRAGFTRELKEIDDLQQDPDWEPTGRQQLILESRENIESGSIALDALDPDKVQAYEQARIKTDYEKGTLLPRIEKAKLETEILRDSNSPDLTDITEVNTVIRTAGESGINIAFDSIGKNKFKITSIKGDPNKLEEWDAVPGAPDHYMHGQSLYRIDPTTGAVTKLGVDDATAVPRLGIALVRMYQSDPAAQRYSAWKGVDDTGRTDAQIEADGFYEYDDRKFPYDKQMERHLKGIKELAKRVSAHTSPLFSP